MNISGLDLKNFRNYERESFEFSGGVNIFIGDNAQGKTSVLEAIHILCTSKSFRTHADDEFIRIGEDHARIEANGQISQFQRSFLIQYPKDGKKHFFINGKKIAKISDFIGKINASVLSPNDITIIHGDSSARRRFMDIVLSQTDPVYFDNLVRFHKSIKNKNILLKLIKLGKESYQSLEPWNKQIISLSVYIVNKRRELIDNIKLSANIIHNSLSNNSENFKIVYEDSVYKGEIPRGDDYEIALLNKQKRVRDEEIARGIALVGPHKDELGLLINDTSVKHYGSQGQQRSAAISLRLAETEYIHEIIGEYPVLLVDDIFSELDDHRKAYFMNLLNKQTQMFLTGTRLSEFSSLLHQAKVFEIRQGKVGRSGHEC